MGIVSDAATPVLRNCVFCGNPPVDKTNEHILPQWLISITGDPHRPMHLGPFLSRDQPFMEIPYTSFQFPACKSCNLRYSSLEAEAQAVITSLLSDGPVSSEGFNALLDWLDKVRVGIWLAYLMLDKNFHGIDPNFRIDGRLSLKDRALVLYRCRPGPSHLGLLSSNTPAFVYNPTCFTLVINHLAIQSVSTDFLVARPLGLPYARTLRLRPDEMMAVPLPLIRGTRRLHQTLLPLTLDRRGTIIAQGIYSQYRHLDPDAYSTDHVRRLSLTPAKTVPIIRTQTVLAPYAAVAPTEWIPPSSTHTHPEFILRLAHQSLLNQIELLGRVRLSSNIPSKKRRQLQATYSDCIKVNRFLLRQVSATLNPS